MVRIPKLVLIAASLSVLSAVAGASGLQPPADAPMPDLERFKAEVRKRLDPDRDVLSQYTFMERREEIDVTRFGKVKKGPVKVYEVHPSPESGNTWKRLISVDGKPLSPTELESNDRIHREHLAARQRESPAEKAKREREDAKDVAETRAAIDELFRLYDIRVVGREQLGGHPVIAVRLDPKPNYRPRTKEGEWMKHMRLRAWIHETDYEVVRAEADVLEDVTVGWGLVGRIHKGATGRFDRTKVNGEVWLPKRAVVNATGRSLVFRTFTIDAVTEWWDFKRFRVETREQIGRSDLR
jgi:hypothetical protein